MSEAQTAGPDEAAAAKAPPAPVRGRAPRVDLNRRRRRNRNDGNLDRMHQFKLDCIPASALDLENYVYRWVNDSAGRLRAATRSDDYDFVQSHELGDEFDTSATDSESTERVRMVVGTEGNQPLYAYLLRKPRAFHRDDYETVVEAREDMMDQRVVGRVEADGERRPGYADDALVEDEAALALPDNAYVPKGKTQVGSATARRRGPIARKK